MARRSRRRFFKRPKADMAWLFSAFSDSLVIGDGDNYRDDVELFTFEDITAGDDDPISREKSDWFIVRMLLDVEVNFARADDLSNPVSMIVGAVASCDQAALPAVTKAPGTEEYMDSVRRVFNMQMVPAYANGLLPTTAHTAVTTTASSATYLNVMAPFHGPAWMKADVKTKASLTDQDSVVFSYGPLVDPASGAILDGTENDVYIVKGFARFLLQRRRA